MKMWPSYSRKNFLFMERSKLLEEKKAALEIRERRIIAALCSQKPSSEEVQWYERQMKLFESDDPEVCFAAMDNMIAGYRPESRTCS